MEVRYDERNPGSSVLSCHSLVIHFSRFQIGILVCSVIAYLCRSAGAKPARGVEDNIRPGILYLMLV